MRDPTSSEAEDGVTSTRLGIDWIAASPVTEPDLAVTRNVARPRAVTVPSWVIEPACVWLIAQVTAAFGIGLPALSRTTARIFRVRPARTWELSEGLWTMG